MGTSRARADETAEQRTLASDARRYRGRAPEERRRARRGRLIEAAVALFGTEGFTETTIERICARAAVATRHFYEEFESREALLRAAYDQVICDTRQAVLVALEGAGSDPRERTRASLDAFLHSYLDDPRRGRIACIEVVGVSPELERHRRSVIHEFAQVIAYESERSARAGHMPVRDFTLGAIAMAGATNELVIEWFTRPDPPAIDELRDELLGLFIAVLEGSRAAAAHMESLRA